MNFTLAISTRWSRKSSSHMSTQMVPEKVHAVPLFESFGIFHVLAEAFLCSPDYCLECLISAIHWTEFRMDSAIFLCLLQLSCTYPCHLFSPLSPACRICLYINRQFQKIAVEFSHHLVFVDSSESDCSWGHAEHQVEKASCGRLFFQYFRQGCTKAIITAYVPGQHMWLNGPWPDSMCSKTVEVRCLC